jgi:hypothetical protein
LAFTPSLMTKTIFFSPGSPRSSVIVVADPFEPALGVRALDRLGGALDERLLDGAADVEVDLLALERFVDLRLIELLVARGTRRSRCAGARGRSP